MTTPPSIRSQDIHQGAPLLSLFPVVRALPYGHGLDEWRHLVEMLIPNGMEGLGWDGGE